ncbi:MAG TPA: methyltransferase domain-containing protein [Blastocatellia bacterium]|nr:methyltransferase domain-containing protein [Blastocatellia bacterium]
MGDLQHYVIRGGIAGRERLRILSRVMRASTTSLFDRLGVAGEMLCLDAGCGGGDVTLELARRVAPNGKAVGADIDGAKVEMARREAAELGIGNVEFRILDIRESQLAAEFDVVYARFLLTHLPDPAGAVNAFYRCLRPGGLVIIEDIDFSGYFVFPESRAFRRYLELYCEAVQRRGGNPNIGPRLPLLLKDGGFARVDLNVVQPMSLEGEVKLMNPLTMENIADALMRDELASREEIANLVHELYEYAADPTTLAGTPRVVQTWGWRPVK